MDRNTVYLAIDSERQYQQKETANSERPEMVEDFQIGHAILAMEHLLLEARHFWYSDNPEKNFQTTMHRIRKVAGVAVQMGEKYGMPDR